MDFGALSDYFRIVVAKNLTGTDIDRMVSHGHELGGFGRFRPFLGDADRKSIPATYVYLDDEDMVSERAWTSWYDSRRQKTHRGPEYRLYYPDVAPVNTAVTGDLAVVAITKENELLFLFAKKDSEREDDVLYLFGLEEDSDRYKPSRDMKRRIDAFGAELLQLLGVEIRVPYTLEYYATEMLDKWPTKFPSGRAFSSFARYAAGIDPRDDPDLALVEFYNTQTALFMAYERYEYEARLAPLVRNVSDPDYDEILKVAMSLFQRRRSAAGHALEYHLEAVFDAFRIAYKPQGRTEGKEKPDFLFPSEEAYQDPDFPDAGLTLLGAKTTAKDRWRQVLQEGDRVNPKHLITLEPAITTDQTDDMAMRGLQLVVPAPIQASYTPRQRRWLWTLGRFCAHVSDLQARFQ